MTNVPNPMQAKLRSAIVLGRKSDADLLQMDEASLMRLGQDFEDRAREIGGMRIAGKSVEELAAGRMQMKAYCGEAMRCYAVISAKRKLPEHFRAMATGEASPHSLMQEGRKILRGEGN